MLLSLIALPRDHHLALHSSADLGFLLFLLPMSQAALDLFSPVHPCCDTQGSHQRPVVSRDRGSTYTSSTWTWSSFLGHQRDAMPDSMAGSHGTSMSASTEFPSFTFAEKEILGLTEIAKRQIHVAVPAFLLLKAHTISLL